MMANGNANIIEFDDSTGGFIMVRRNSGVLLKQDTSAFSTSSINGSYAFGFVGIDSSKNRFGMAGAVSTARWNGELYSGVLDSDDSSSGASGAVSITGGAYTVASYGRGTATIGNAQGSLLVTASTLSVKRTARVGIDTFRAGGNPLVSGTILQQSSNALSHDGNFSGPSVFEVTALDASTAESQVGAIHWRR